MSDHKAWAAMNNVIVKRNSPVNHQVISNEIVAALSAAGYAIVPKEASMEMIAAHNAVGHTNENEQAIKDWEAMVEAGRVKG